MNTGERIRSLRNQSGLTLDDVASAIGTIKQTIYKYEHGIVTNIPDDKIAALSDALKTTPGYLRCLTNDPRPLHEQIKLASVFRDRASQIIKNLDPSDMYEVFGTSAGAILDNLDAIVSIDDADDIASALGVSLDYLTGRVDDPEESVFSLSSASPSAEQSNRKDTSSTSKATDALMEALAEIGAIDSNGDVSEEGVSIVADFVKRNADILRRSMPSASDAQLTDYTLGRIYGKHALRPESNEDKKPE